jgi:hypothetical protein
MLLLNAFSLNMIAAPAVVSVTPITLERARELLEGRLDSAVGHPSTAAVFEAELGVGGVACARRTVTLSPGECAVVGQYRGPRLPEGARELPEGATIEWLLVECITADTVLAPRELLVACANALSATANELWDACPSSSSVCRVSRLAEKIRGVLS